MTQNAFIIDIYVLATQCNTTSEKCHPKFGFPLNKIANNKSQTARRNLLVDYFVQKKRKKTLLIL